MRKVYVYRVQATSVAGFLQVLAANYLPAGCVFYSQGLLKPHMNARDIDAKIIAHYDIAISKDARYWRKTQGLAVVHLLRYRLSYLILASPGQHPFFQHEVNIKDARTSPIHFHDYSVSVKDGHSCVRLSPQIEEKLRHHFRGLACFRSATALEREFHNLPYEPYKPVVSQLLKILRLVNAKRKKHSKELVPETCIRKRRRIRRAYHWRDADYDPAEDFAAGRGAASIASPLVVGSSPGAASAGKYASSAA